MSVDTTNPTSGVASENSPALRKRLSDAWTRVLVPGPWMVSIAVFVLVVLSVCGFSSLKQVGHPFPGFFLWENQTIPNISASGWPLGGESKAEQGEGDSEAAAEEPVEGDVEVPEGGVAVEGEEPAKPVLVGGAAREASLDAAVERVDSDASGGAFVVAGDTVPARARVESVEGVRVDSAADFHRRFAEGYAAWERREKGGRLLRELGQVVEAGEAGERAGRLVPEMADALKADVRASGLRRACPDGILYGVSSNERDTVSGRDHLMRIPSSSHPETTCSMLRC